MAMPAARPSTIKQPATASRGMVTSNHPLASQAGIEVLLAGGNAVDAAIATMFALTVVEPMMVTIFGAGFVHIRLADGRSTVIDNYATVPAAAHADVFTPIPGSLDHEVEGRLNELGHQSVATGGTLLGWATAVERYGRLPLSAVVAPAVRFARGGFRVSPYLRACIGMAEDDMRRFPETARVFLPDNAVPAVGSSITRNEYAETLETIGSRGPGYLYGGPLGAAIADDMAANGGFITRDDITAYQVFERAPVAGRYRDRYEVLAPPPPSSGGAHILQILNILAGDDVGAMGFGTPDSVHLLAEAMKIAFADRFRYMADPLTTPIPLAWLTSPAYGAERRAQVSLTEARQYLAGEPTSGEHDTTTHCCAVDEDGNVVATTNTLHMVFGSKVTVPGTGMLLNDCMQLMDPVPGRTNSIAPGKRILSSMSPCIVLKDGRPFLTLGTPGGLRIFGSVLQAIVNVIDHGMTLQQAFEAPRLWDRGPVLELERGFAGLAGLRAEMERRGHVVETPFKVAGGMNGILVRDDGILEGAACWRADGVAVGYSGGDGLVDGEGPAMWGP